MEAGAKGAKQSESPDSTKELSEHMFVLGKPYIVTNVIRQVLGKPNNVTQVTGVVTKVTSFGLDKSN